MKANRRMDEIVSRVASILAYYRLEDGGWDARPPMTGELRAAIEELSSVEQEGPQVRLRFYRSLEAELVARFDRPVGQRLVSLARGVAAPVFREAYGLSS